MTLPGPRLETLPLSKVLADKRLVLTTAANVGAKVGAVGIGICIRNRLLFLGVVVKIIKHLTSAGKFEVQRQIVFQILEKKRKPQFHRCFKMES